MRMYLDKKLYLCIRICTNNNFNFKKFYVFRSGKKTRDLWTVRKV